MRTPSADRRSILTHGKSDKCLKGSQLKAGPNQFESERLLALCDMIVMAAHRQACWIRMSLLSDAYYITNLKHIFTNEEGGLEY